MEHFKKGRARAMASERIKMTGVLTGDYSFERPAFGYGTETVTIYKISGEDGKTYIWKTTGCLGMNVEVPFETRGAYLYDSDKRKAWMWESPDKGDTVTFTASIKCESEYKGEPQTELQRVKVVAIERKPEEHKPAKREIAPLQDGDMAIEMPYRQFKEHYSDCETMPDSFRRDEHNGNSYITVVVRAGRMKASGVRGKHFHGFEIEFTDGGKYGFCSYRAVSTENAIKQARKDFPNAEGFRCRRIYG
jgi:hypothetical protein